MAIAFDAATSLLVTGTTSSFTHTPVDTPRAVLLLVSQGDSDSESIDETSVTYGGVSMTPFDASPFVDSSSETGVIYGFFLGASIPTGAQTVAWTQTVSVDRAFLCITYTAAGDTEINTVDAGIMDTGTPTSPSDTIALNGISSAVAMAWRSGAGNFTGFSYLTNWDGDASTEMDFGVSIGGVVTYDIVGTSDVTYGWTQPANTAQGLAVAIKEAAGGGATTLTPSLFSDGDTFHAATVSVGAVTLTPALYSDADTFHAATVSQGGAPQTLTPDLYADGDTFHTPTVGRGAVTLTPSLYADADTFHNATVSKGAVTLTPALYSDGDTFHAATVGRGAVTLTPALVSDGDTFHTHAVVLEGGPQTLSPDLVVDGDTFHAATVTPGAVTLTPSIYTDADTFHAAEVSAGYNLQPEAYADPDTFYTATVSGGAVTLAPELLVDADTFYPPTLTFGQVLAPVLFTDADTFHAPSVFLGVRRTVELLTAAARDTQLTAPARDTLLESRNAIHG